MDPLLGTTTTASSDDPPERDEELGQLPNDNDSDDDAVSDVSDLPAPYGTRAAPAMPGASLESLWSSQHDREEEEEENGSDVADLDPTTNNLPYIAAEEEVESPESNATKSTAASNNSQSPVKTATMGVLSSLPSRTRSRTSRRQQQASSDDNDLPMRGSFLDSLRREGLTTINSGRALLRSHDSSQELDTSHRSANKAKATKASDSKADPLWSSAPPRLSNTATASNTNNNNQAGSQRNGLGGSSSHHDRRSHHSRRSSLVKSKLRGVTKSRRFANQGKTASRSDLNFVEEPPTELIRSATIRRYSPGESVLINNQHLGWIRLVNKHGFPPGFGASIEERKGPYRFVLATVKEIHFDEVQPYYTVTIMHSGVDERADAQYMHPLLTLAGEQAAVSAATRSMDYPELHDEHGRGVLSGQADDDKDMTFCDYVICYSLSILLPFVWMYETCDVVGRKYVLPFARSVLAGVRSQGALVLNGKRPYMCPLRFTLVNFVVLCSIWYVFMDMIRLSFVPPSMDDAIARADLFVWIVLVLELFFQVFIRPDGFKQLILTDKAYSPTTIRFINWFHLWVELLSLLMFVPEFACVFDNDIDCSDASAFSFHKALLLGTIGPMRLDSLAGHSYIALVRLRVFGLVRHWRNMWITNTFIKMKWAGEHTDGLRALIPLKSSARKAEKRALLVAKKETPEQMEARRKDEVLASASTIGTALMATNSYRALGLYWCIFGLFPIIFCISSTFVNPVGSQMTELLGSTNMLANDNTTATCQFLAGSVWAWITSVAPTIGTHSHKESPYVDPYLMTLNVLPQRCPFQDGSDILRQFCQTLDVVDEDEPINSTSDLSWSVEREESLSKLCNAWSLSWNMEPTPQDIASATKKRQGSILPYSSGNSSNLTLYLSGDSVSVENETFLVTTTFDATRSVELASTACLLSQICLLFGVLGGLSVLRRDAEVLVLNPLRRMLKKVAQYAKNPLAQARTPSGRSSGRYASKTRRSNESLSSSSSDSGSDDDRELGSFETEQLITAVSKITDLLRKCWGVAGADIISTNLAAREGALEVFNPTVPGKSVYALFGFAYINDFDHILMSLQDDVMILINDVASVLHSEVFRWGFGDSGQCNKNLGAAFLMVFRIGLVKEVIEKLEQATDVIFSNSKGTNTQGTAMNRTRRGNQRGATGSARGLESSRSIGSSSRDDMSNASSHLRNTKRTRALKKKQKEIDPKTLSLQSLPGISTFTDRAVIGMLKAFAGIHRDNKIRNWNNDFRLSAGVGAFEVSMIYGMDAGWAVEGAVGSEYKIDATYLSPHVNMASRMMMASKQYGVKIMLSQSVQELMSDVANTKLRHLDTVTVKGSSVKQRIYTYDARAQGVDFFLFSRTDEQADYDAEKYTPRIWDMDQDLLSMRQHVSEKFLSVYRKGHKAYIQGDWEKALPLLEQANEIMVETALEEGYLEDQFEALQMQAGDDAKAAEEELKRLNGDGPSLYLVAFMKSLGGKAPDDWEGWHPLTRK